jgi:cyanate permease
MTPANRVLLVLLACWIAVCPACWAVGPPRTSTLEERQTATLAVDTAQGTGYLTAADAEALRALIRDSEKTPQSWQQLGIALATLAASHLVTRLDRGAPERVRKQQKGGAA